MNVETFYALVAGVCFALLGLWWNAVSAHIDWLKDDHTRALASGIYLAFLVPAAMSLGAQIGGDSKLVWRAVFILAALLGGFFTTRYTLKTRHQSARLFHKSRWLITVVYALILVVAVFPELGKMLGLTGLQVEAFLICLLVLMGHGLAWEFITDRR